MSPLFVSCTKSLLHVCHKVLSFKWGNKVEIAVVYGRHARSKTRGVRNTGETGTIHTSRNRRSKSALSLLTLVLLGRNLAEYRHLSDGARRSRTTKIHLSLLVSGSYYMYKAPPLCSLDCSEPRQLRTKIGPCRIEFTQFVHLFMLPAFGLILGCPASMRE